MKSETLTAAESIAKLQEKIDQKAVKIKKLSLSPKKTALLSESLPAP